MRYGFAPFLAIGIAFIVLGITGQKAFLGIGAAFVVLGLVMAVRNKRQ